MCFKNILGFGVLFTGLCLCSYAQSSQYFEERKTSLEQRDEIESVSLIQENQTNGSLQAADVQKDRKEKLLQELRKLYEQNRSR